jgi:hypothetical protein
VDADYLTILKLPSGNYHVFVIGRPGYHIMDWRGCNFLKWPVPGQPFRGFKKAKDVIKFYCDCEEREKEIFKEAQYHEGTFYSDYSKYEMMSVKEVEEDEQIEKDIDRIIRGESIENFIK